MARLVARWGCMRAWRDQRGFHPQKKRKNICPTFSSWMYECFTIIPCLTQASLVLPSLSHDCCFKFFLWLQSTTWSSSVHGRMIRSDGLSKKAKAAAGAVYLCSEVPKIIGPSSWSFLGAWWFNTLHSLLGNNHWTCLESVQALERAFLIRDASARKRAKKAF